MGHKGLKRDKADKILLISIAVLIVITAIVFFSSQKDSGEITLRAVEEGEEETAVVRYEPSCSDNDGGIVYSVSGVAKSCNENGECSSGRDSCSGNELKEWYCTGSELAYEDKLCEGECDAGKCIKFVTEKKTIYGSGGGGGGGGSSGGSSGGGSTPIAEESNENYNVGSNLLEQTVELAKGDSVSFEIGGQGYTLTVSDNSATQVSLSVSGISKTIDVGGEEYIDLNTDADNDLWIRFKSFSTVTNKAKLILNNV